MFTVHHFRVWDIAIDCWLYPPLKSPVERIEKEARGEIIPDTAEGFIPPISTNTVERAR
jgi:hypothetical protein